MATEPVFNNVAEWMAENEKFFLPPVCNKMMHNFQLKVRQTNSVRSRPIRFLLFDQLMRISQSDCSVEI